MLPGWQERTKVQASRFHIPFKIKTICKQTFLTIQNLNMSLFQIPIVSFKSANLSITKRCTYKIQQARMVQLLAHRLADLTIRFEPQLGWDNLFVIKFSLSGAISLNQILAKRGPNSDWSSRRILKLYNLSRFEAES